MSREASRIIESLHSHRLVDGLTHNFYSYPARFSPELTKEIIKTFSNSGDWILDPFMGGGTSVVEALAMGRYAIGCDVNSLAWFIAISKTTPISTNEIAHLRRWTANISHVDLEDYPSLEIAELKRHFPKRFLRFLDSLLDAVDSLPSRNVSRLARFIILRVYQNTLSERGGFPTTTLLRKRIELELEKIISGLEKFIEACKGAGFTKQEIVPSRKLLNRSAIGIENDNKVQGLIKLPQLVFTSPPYPGVHVLYNKWQIASRKETYLPYYICGLNYSQPESAYTFGGRSRAGVLKYFGLITQSFLSISKVIHPKAVVVQLIGFSNSDEQLPLYLKAMEQAGYEEIFPLSADKRRLWRDVPNRKWYAKAQKKWDSSKEVLLFHRINNHK
jgi:hypothetical protein